MDAALAVGYTAVAVLIGREYHDQWLPLDTLGYALTVTANLPVAFRRRAPATVLAVCLMAWIVSITIGYYPALNVYGSMVALYTLTAERPRWMAVTGGGLVAGTWIYAGALAARASMASVIVQAVVFVAVVSKFGDNAGKLAARNRELAEVTERLRVEQADRARRAVADERMRIAGELHDIVAHHMSVIAVQAGMAAYVHDRSPEDAKAAVGVIADAAREGQEELRRMLGLLRAPTGDAEGVPDAAAPGLSAVGGLVERMRAAGVPTRQVVVGRPRPLPAGIELCAYRVIQESLTNVLKHAGPAQVTVTTEFHVGELAVRVSDDGTGLSDDGTGLGDVTGSGHGLIGMRERARLYGGTVTAGPRAGGGFEVVLTLPATPERTER
ncbi:MAG: sensor histidine kinase [Hamadaea sp.]|nr:sensor histidine kinase [Hamadaea sp.]